MFACVVLRLHHNFICNAPVVSQSVIPMSLLHPFRLSRVVTMILRVAQHLLLV
jgi:hypothetical protein